ncbi:hypothetical protein ACIQ9J_25860 [Streptomyces sp. NPDC094153]|uniref:hypothetical protein n=1 Tax=Streptomyces sp. NPDC094153 TaxID=3366058 RepID=UPI0037FCACD2
MTTNDPAGGPVCAARARRQHHAATAGTASLDLETVFARLPSLDDEQLQDLVHDLDSALSGCRGGLLDDTDMDLITVAAAARIALRRRQSAAGRSRAARRVRQLTSTETTE